MASWNWYDDEWKPLTKLDAVAKIITGGRPNPKKKSHKLAKYACDGGVKRSNDDRITQKRANVCNPKHIIYVDL